MYLSSSLFLLIAFGCLSFVLPDPASLPDQETRPLGIGMVQPLSLSGTPLYFYRAPDFTQMPDEMTPTDSITFADPRGHSAIATAPPWLFPEVMIIDYDLLLFRAITLTRFFIEVEVNRMTGQTAWVDRSMVSFRSWSAFLLDVYSVEVDDVGANPVRIKPLDHASIISEAYLPLKPLAVRGEWLQVSTEGLADRIPPTGWIRWRKGNQFLISYSLLS